MIFNIIKQHRLFKVLSLNSFSVVVNFFLGIFSTKIISIVLGTAGMSTLGSFRNFTAIFKSIATLGVSNSVIKLFVENKNDKKELSIIFSTFFWFFLFVSAVTGIVALIFAETFSKFIFFNLEFVIPIRVFGLVLPFVVINVFWTAIYNGLEKFNRIVIIQIISNFLVFGFTAFLILKNNIKGGLFSIALGELLMFIVTYLFVRKDKSFFRFELKKKIDRKYFKVIVNFSVMAFLSAIIVPLTLIFIRNYIVKTHSINDAGIWDATNKLSFFYMSIFSSGLSLYYMPKLASLRTDSEFKTELKYYFKVFVPLFMIVLLMVFLFRDLILNIAFTKEFVKIKEVIIWQLFGDLFRVMSLAFGYQIVVKSKVKEYFAVEIIFNLTYLILSYYLVEIFSFEGALQSYFYANLLIFITMLFMFRELFGAKSFQLV